MIGIGWYKKEKNDRKVFKYMEEHQGEKLRSNEDDIEKMNCIVYNRNK